MLYLQTLKGISHLEYIKTFLVEFFFKIILVNLSRASSVTEYTDSCSDSSKISLCEAEGEEETVRMENLEITLDSSSDLPIDYGLNGDNHDWQRRPSIYSSYMDTESIH